jgi:CRISPR system Cascade subunit CasC
MGRGHRPRFADGIPEADRATRTKKITELLADRLTATLDREQAERLAAALVEPPGIKKSANQSAYLLFFGKRQLDNIVALLDNRIPELEALPDTELKEAIGALPDIAAPLYQRRPPKPSSNGPRLVAV